MTKRELETENEFLKDRLLAHEIALSRCPYPPDVSAILSEWQPRSADPERKTYPNGRCGKESSAQA